MRTPAKEKCLSASYDTKAADPTWGWYMACSYASCSYGMLSLEKSAHSWHQIILGTMQRLKSQGGARPCVKFLLHFLGIGGFLFGTLVLWHENPFRNTAAFNWPQCASAEWNVHVTPNLWSGGPFAQLCTPTTCVFVCQMVCVCKSASDWCSKCTQCLIQQNLLKYVPDLYHMKHNIWLLGSNCSRLR